jgi:hypothetical protein
MKSSQAMNNKSTSTLTEKQKKQAEEFPRDGYLRDLLLGAYRNMGGWQNMIRYKKEQARYGGKESFRFLIVGTVEYQLFREFVENQPGIPIERNEHDNDSYEGMEILKSSELSVIELV